MRAGFRGRETAAQLKPPIPAKGAQGLWSFRGRETAAQLKQDGRPALFLAAGGFPRS